MNRQFGKRAALCTAFAVLAAPSLVWSQTPRTRPDILPDVTVTGRPTITPDKADVIATRMPRVARCLVPDGRSPDPTGAFNQAYYEELTGEAGFYDTIRKPPRKVRHTYPPALIPPESMFRSRTGPMPMPGISSAMPVGPLIPRKFDYPTCLGREAMEKSAPFARAMALYDKGDYAAALEALLALHGSLGPSPMAGEVALMIADAYLKGEGTTKDTALGVQWLKTAAKTPGYDRLSPRYDPQNPGRYYHITTEAAMLLARLYVNGDGVDKDPHLAREWVEVARRGNHVPAMKVAGDMYYVGYGGDKNLRSSRMNYEEAGLYRHAAASFAAAQMYDLGEGGAASRKRAIGLYGQAAQLGSMGATYALAVAYDKGDGVPSNREMALTLYKIAAVGGEAAAQTAIGTYFYEGGSALGKDHAQARAWFGEAAIRGDVDAMVNLAAMLIKGEGGEPDLVKAYAWLAIAREGGREDAGAGLASLEVRMSATDLASAKALIAPAKDAS